MARKYPENTKTLKDLPQTVWGQGTPPVFSSCERRRNGNKKEREFFSSTPFLREWKRRGKPELNTTLLLLLFSL